jgi:predicted ester cyclase
MDTESAKALVRQVVDDWNRGDLDALDEHLDRAYVNRDPNNPEVTDLPSYKHWAAAARAAFPDLRVTIEDLIAEGDRVAKLWSFEATHRGEFLGIAPTGRRVTWSGITIYRVAGDKVGECIWRTDALGLLQQLGAIPAPGERAVGAPR